MDFLIGKIIKVKIPAYDNYGHKLNTEFTHVTGVCTFAGFNKVLDWPLQVTVAGLPLKIEHINDIEIVK